MELCRNLPSCLPARFTFMVHLVGWGGGLSQSMKQLGVTMAMGPPHYREHDAFSVHSHAYSNSAIPVPASTVDSTVRLSN